MYEATWQTWALIRNSHSRLITLGGRIAFDALDLFWRVVVRALASLRIRIECESQLKSSNAQCTINYTTENRLVFHMWFGAFWAERRRQIVNSAPNNNNNNNAEQRTLLFVPVIEMCVISSSSSVEKYMLAYSQALVLGQIWILLLLLLLLLVGVARVVHTLLFVVMLLRESYAYNVMSALYETHTQTHTCAKQTGSRAHAFFAFCLFFPRSSERFFLGRNNK